ncbi:MAG: DUF732 domain-containing protein [Mycobacterium sp.]|nr:DUF732 domain-containing protein [Mycobacterium sp.]
MTTFGLRSPSMDSGDDTPTDLALTGVDPGVPVSLGETEVVTAWGACDDETPTPTETHTWRSAWAHAAVFITCAAVVAAVISICGWVWMQMKSDTPVSTLPSSGHPWPPYPTCGAGVTDPECEPASTQTPSVSAPAPAAACAADPACIPGGAPRLPDPAPTVTVQAAAPTTTVTVQAEPPAPTRAAAPPRAATPSRSSADDAYLDTLRGDNIIITDPARVIRAAHALCEYIHEGHTAHQAQAEILSENSTFTPENASTIVGAAIGTYCPDYTGQH